MAQDDNQDTRDSVFTAITLGDLLGRSGLPRLDDHFGDAPTQPFPAVPAQRSASPYVMPRRKNIARDMVPLEGVEPRADRTFTRMSEPGRRPITSTGVALTVGSLAGATIMFGSPTITPAEPSTPGQSDAGHGGGDAPVAPASFPSPLSWAAGLGLPPSAQSRGVVPSSHPAGGRSSSSAAIDAAPHSLGEILALHSGRLPVTSPSAPHIGDLGNPSTGAQRSATPSTGRHTAGAHTLAAPASGAQKSATPSSGAHTLAAPDSARAPAGPAISSLTPPITAEDANPGRDRSGHPSTPTAKTKDQQSSQNSRTSESSQTQPGQKSETGQKSEAGQTSESSRTDQSSGTAKGAGSSKASGTTSNSRSSRSSGTARRSGTASGTRGTSKPSAARPSTSTSKRSTSGTGGTAKSSSGTTKRSTGSRVAGGSSKSSGGTAKSSSSRTKSSSSQSSSRSSSRSKSSSSSGGSKSSGSHSSSSSHSSGGGSKSSGGSKGGGGHSGGGKSGGGSGGSSGGGGGN